MKRLHYLHLIAALLLIGGMTSCNDDNGTPTIETVETLSGLYVINNGNMAANIPSSITSYDSFTGSSTPALQDAFKTANGVPLGEGAQQALIYGSKMYIPMHDSNLIWVVNKQTLKIEDYIRPEGEASGPRSLAAADGKVYASMFSGYVAKIDTVTLKIEKTLKTGPNSDQVAIANGKLYVANSDGYNYDGGYADCSISVIDLASFSESKIKDISKVLNPTDLATNGKEVFVICKGDYGEVPSTVKKIVGNDVVDVALGNYMAVNEDKLYVINSPYGIPRKDMGFDVYSTITLKKEGEIIRQTEGSESWIESPSGIFADPISGDIVILSYTLSEAGYSQYKEPCYANIYDTKGNFIKRIECGIGALGVTFVHKTQLK
ncbi:MAG: hypothetical protein K2H46_05750 [Muribaculaceae bacterium]|nr:hypothetical protein [Muribaculaceae bacterium]